MAEGSHRRRRKNGKWKNPNLQPEKDCFCFAVLFCLIKSWVIKGCLIKRFLERVGLARNWPKISWWSFASTWCNEIANWYSTLLLQNFASDGVFLVFFPNEFGFLVCLFWKLEKDTKTPLVEFNHPKHNFSEDQRCSFPNTFHALNPWSFVQSGGKYSRTSLCYYFS